MSIQEEIINKRNKIINIVNERQHKYKQPRFKNKSKCFKLNGIIFNYETKNSLVYLNCDGINIIIGEFKNYYTKIKKFQASFIDTALFANIYYNNKYTNKLPTIILNYKTTYDLSSDRLKLSLDHELTHARDNNLHKNCFNEYFFDCKTNPKKFYNQEVEFNAHYISMSIHYTREQIIDTDFYINLTNKNKKRLHKKLYKDGIR